MDEVAKAEAEVVLCMRLWQMSSPEREHQAFVKLLAAQDWLEVVEERAKDLAMVARQTNIEPNDIHYRLAGGTIK